jgi:anti-sigma factor RsiW
MSVTDEREGGSDAGGERGLEASLEHTRGLSDRRAIEEHLRSCDQCRRELRLLEATRARLRRLARPAPDAALRGPIFAALDREAPAAPTAARAPRRWLLAAAGGWAAAAALGVLYVARPGGRGREAGPGGVALPAMVDEALREYERASAGELPRAGERGELEAAFGRPIPYLEGPDLPIVSAWLTTLRGEPSAAIAYRFRDRVLVQFVVSEGLFFRHHAVRDEIARRGSYVAQVGGRAVLGRPGRGVGSLLVGELSPAQLEGLFAQAG